MSDRISEKDAYTIIIGCGRLGSTLANRLSDEGESVTIIDLSQGAFNKLSPSYGGIALQGDGTDFSVLEEANIREATSVITVTDSDNANIMISLMVKELYGVRRVIARLYDPDKECVYQDFGIETVCPATLSATAIEDMMSSKPETGVKTL